MADDVRERAATFADAIDREASDPDFPGGHLGFWRDVEDLLREVAAADIRKAALEEAAQVIERQPHPYGRAGSMPDWFDSTIAKGAERIRALSAPIVPAIIPQEDI
jgi:hypothetical protein